MSTLPNFAATVVITTKNRKGDLARALSSCFSQTLSIEVLVIDDGSDDGTAEMVREKFPRAKLYRSEHSKGLIVQRNFGAQLASAEIILSMDDDAEFSSPEVASSVIEHFSDEKIAAVAVPFINIKYSNDVLQLAPSPEGIWLTNEFIGTAHAVRRSVFLALGGYREYLFHQGEEGDFCIRLLNAGFYVRLASCAPILHHESPNRSLERINVFGQRNLMLFAWHNVPFPEAFFHMFATVVKGLTWGLKNHLFKYRLQGTVRGFSGITHECGGRVPVSRSAYWLYRTLKKRGPVLVNVGTAPARQRIRQ